MSPSLPFTNPLEGKNSYDKKDMEFRRLGNTGLLVSVLGIGGWVTMGGQIDAKATKACLDAAYKEGCNFFDFAEVYAGGECERAVGQALEELAWPRADYVLTTKVFFGAGGGNNPNGKGLSRKHIIEGTKAALHRLRVEYVDVIYAHRHDQLTPMEEIVRAFSWVIDHGYAFYWGCSEWPVQRIQEAIGIAERYGLHAPVTEQSQYNMLHRDRPEEEYRPLIEKYGFGNTIWSPLASGLLSGKYNDGVPEGSRFSQAGFGDSKEGLSSPEGKKKLEKIKQLAQVAKKVDCSMAQLALAWVIKNPHVICITGASKPDQVAENFKAVGVAKKLTPEIMEEIEKILENKPARANAYGRVLSHAI